MNNIGDRIYRFIDYLDIPASQFCKRVGITNPYLLKYYQSGKFEPSIETLETIKKVYPAINLEWLFCGKGRMLKFNHFKDRFKQYDGDKQDNEAWLGAVNFVYDKADGAIAKKMGIMRNSFVAYKEQGKRLTPNIKQKLIKTFPDIPKSWWDRDY